MDIDLWYNLCMFAPSGDFIFINPSKVAKIGLRRKMQISIRSPRDAMFGL